MLPSHVTHLLFMLLQLVVLLLLASNATRHALRLWAIPFNGSMTQRRHAYSLKLLSTSTTY